MTQYVDRTLAPGERILRRGRFPNTLWLVAWLALLVLGIVLVGIFIFAVSAVKMLTTEFAVTDRRVILKRGFFRLDTSELAVGSIESVSVHQGFFGLIFGFGRISITGTGDSQILFPPMADPVGFRSAIEAAREIARNERLAPTPAPARH
jgi:uncharacterized membrane protein YdbT with pleckstrin-like domain